MVHSLLINLPKPQFNENQNTDTYGLFLLHEMFRAEIPNEEIIYTAKLLKDLGKNERALHIVTEIALRRYPPNAIVYLETLAKQEPLRPHYFWPLIMYNFRRHGENGILKTLKLLHTLKVECDKETITQYVMPRLQITLENPLEALQNLDRVGVKASLMMTPIIAHLISQHRITDILSVLEQYPTKIETPLLITPLSSLGIHCRATKRFHQFSKVLAAINSKAEKPKFDFIGLTLQNMLQHNIKVKEDIKSFQRLLQEIHNIGLNISSSSIEAIKGIIAPQEKSSEIYKLLQQLSNNSLQLPESFNNNSVLESQANKNNSITKHPRDMTIDELEFHLIELESKGLNARGVLRRLLQLCVRDNRLERALEIKGKCDALKVQESAGMMASTFELYIKLKDLEKAKATLKHLEKNYSSK